MSSGTIDLSTLSIEEKRRYLRELLSRKSAEPQDSYPLSLGQRGLWIVQRISPANVAYNIHYAARLHPPVEPTIFRQAFEKASERHTALRTTFQERDGVPVQTVQSQLKPFFEVIQTASWDRGQLDQRIVAEADRPFDLTQGPLLRIFLFDCGDDGQVLLLVAHHIAVDFWSLDVLVKEVRDIYQGLTGGSTVTQGPPPQGFQAFVDWQKGFIESGEGQSQWEYWQEQLSGELPVLNLPTRQARPALQTYSGQAIPFDLGMSLSQRLRDLAKRKKTTLFTVLLAAYQVLLSRYTGQEDILVGTPMAGRNQPGFEGMVGCFVNPVVLRAEAQPELSFRGFLSQVRQTVLEAVSDQDYPFSLLVEKLQIERDPSRTPLYQASFVWDRPRLYRPEKDSGFQFETLSSGQRGAPFDITLTIIEVETSLSGILQFNTDLFTASFIDRMEQHFRTLLQGIVDNPECLLGQLPLLTHRERAGLEMGVDSHFHKDADSGDTSLSLAGCVHQVIEAQVERSPESTALIYKDQVLTYRELNTCANQLAHHLRELGVGPDVSVGIMVPRSPEMMVAILGVLKAGGTYVPLDSSNPRERLAFMLQDTQSLAVLTHSSLRGQLPETTARLICLDTDWEAISHHPVTNPVSGVTPPNLAYIIYTSGSTGQPKGVMLPHRALMNYLCWAVNEYRVSQGKGVPVHTPIRFDLTVTSLFAPLMTGNYQILIPEESGVEGLASVIRNSQDLAFVKLTPAHMKVLEPLLEDVDLKGRFRSLVIGGEALYAHHLTFWRAKAPQARLINEYGPTEAAVGCCIYDAQPVVPFPENIPIGHPVANTQLYVVDRSLQLVPKGVVGELLIGGESLADGYLNRPDLTAERFVPNPFSKDPALRLYRTGDLARYLEDGNLEYLGRTDHQVKIHGYRIELGEVESALLRAPQIREALVIAQETGPGDKRLVAYAVSRDDREPNITALRAFLRGLLPDYMIPSAFVFLPAFPLTSHGKIDRKALPLPDGSRPELGQDFIPPRNPVESQLAEIWQSVLAIERIGIHDNFFDLGGASIQSLETASRASRAGLPLTPEMLFQYQTIAQLAEVLEQRGITESHRFTTEPTETVVTTPVNPPREVSIHGGEVLAETVSTVGNTLIESIGVYLPQKVMTTAELIAGCRVPIDFPLEKMTGIHSRRVVGENEFSLDLARKAIEDCLSRSSYSPDEIDLLICCNISRQDGPGQFSFEPSSAARLKHTFGLVNATAFDLSNACAGMFTGIKTADSYLRSGAAHCALVVSGEYISHLAATAQKEIEGFMDPRLACLTVGDAGAALLLDSAPDDSVGFHLIDLYTLGQYSSLCIAKATDREHGGAIMVTDSIRQTAVALRQTVAHSAYTLRRKGWEARDIQHIIMHQTSETALRDAMREINATLKQNACHDRNTIINLGERGNTASTSHSVALYDQLQAGRFQAGDKVIFGVTGSGQVIGTALYTFDNLPERFRSDVQDPSSSETPSASVSSHPPKRESTLKQRPPLAITGPRVRIAGLGTVVADPSSDADAVSLASEAADRCIAAAGVPKQDIGLVIHSGVYRNEYLSEPALAAIIAGNLGINAEIRPLEEKHTFTFDILNGGLGFLNACQVAVQMMAVGGCNNVLVTASEIENNRGIAGTQPRGLLEAGAAVMLSAGTATGPGFGSFAFASLEDPAKDLATYSTNHNGKTVLEMQQPSLAWDQVLGKICPVVEECLAQEGLTPATVRWVFSPQPDRGLSTHLSQGLGISLDRFINLPDGKGDYFTCTLPFTFQHVLHEGLARPGDVALIISVASGFQAGCATYHF